MPFDKPAAGANDPALHQTSSAASTGVGMMDLDDETSIQNERPSLESMLVDRALDTVLQLPHVSDEMEAKARDTEKEIESLQCCLTENEDLLCQETERLSKVKEELASVLRQMWLTKEQSLENHQKCQALQKEIGQLLTENVRLTRHVSCKSLEFERTTKAHAVYLSKMKDHEERIEQREKTLPVFKQLEEEREKLSGLMQRRCECMETDSAADTKVDETEQECLDADLDNIITLIQEEKEKQEKLKQQMDVLTKRNTARKIRLKNQLKETVGRNRHSNEEMHHLEHAILVLQKELEE